MRKGYAIIRDDGVSLSINCEDFDVEFFGGGDYEFEYNLDPENREKLSAALQQEGQRSSLKEMITAYFGECLDNVPFTQFCKDRDIQYELFTWTS